MPAARALPRVAGMDGEHRRWLTPLTDVLLAVAVFALSVQAIHDEHGGWPACLAAAGQTLPVAARRVAPFAVNVVVAPSSILSTLADWPALPAPLGPLIAIHAAAAWAHRWQAAVVLAGALIAVPATLLSRAAEADSVEGLHTVLLIVIAWLLGHVGRYRRAALTETEHRVEMLHRLRDAEAAGAVAAERALIAREMHDLLGHSVSVMVVLAEGGAAASSDGAATRAFDGIAERGRRTLTDLRMLLRDGVGALRPLPGLTDLAELVERTRQAGVAVSLHGAVDLPVSASAGLAVHRIVQESLTNAVRHAAGEPVRVEIGKFKNTLAVRVTNPVRTTIATAAAEWPAPGNGLRGMRERAASAGGILCAGPSDGVWAVDLRIPLDEGSGDDREEG
jgi:signal transduction histidine kinase